MNNSKERSFTRFIDMHRDKYQVAVDNTSEPLATLWFMLLVAFNLKAVTILTKINGGWSRIYELDQDPSTPKPKPNDHKALMEKTYEEKQPNSLSLPLEQSEDGNALVQEVAALPIEYNDSRKILFLSKRSVIPPSEVHKSYLFTGYRLEDYKLVIDAFIQVHNQHVLNLKKQKNDITIGELTAILGLLIAFLTFIDKFLELLSKGIFGILSALLIGFFIYVIIRFQKRGHLLTMVRNIIDRLSKFIKKSVRLVF